MKENVRFVKVDNTSIHLDNILYVRDFSEGGENNMSVFLLGGQEIAFFGEQAEALKDTIGSVTVFAKTFEDYMKSMQEQAQRQDKINDEIQKMLKDVK